MVVVARVAVAWAAAALGRRREGRDRAAGVMAAEGRAAGSLGVVWAAALVAAAAAAAGWEVVLVAAAREAVERGAAATEAGAWVAAV